MPSPLLSQHAAPRFFYCSFCSSGVWERRGGGGCQQGWTRHCIPIFAVPSTALYRGSLHPADVALLFAPAYSHHIVVLLLSLLLLLLRCTEVRSILLSARSQVKALLTEHLDQLHMLAGALVEHETLNASQIKVCVCVCRGGGGTRQKYWLYLTVIQGVGEQRHVDAGTGGA